MSTVSPAVARRHPAAIGLSTAFAAAGCLLLAACGSSTSAGSSATATTTATTTAATTGSSPTATGSAVGTTALIPTSCAGIPLTLIGADIGGVAVTRSLGTAPSLSCEFANAGATHIIVVNLGAGGAAQFAVLKAASAGGGRTITPIPGLGSSAFEISKAGVVRGVDALSARNVVVSVSADQPLPKTEAIVQQLVSLY